MACFLVPMTEAIVLTVAQKVLEKKENAPKTYQVRSEDGYATVEGIPFSKKLGWLNKLLWGGSALLAFEHLWHGEIVPFFPFLTAATEGPEAVSEMLGEMGSTGVTMAVLVTAVWIGMLLVSKALEKKALDPQPAAK